jgi:hypothetical protein
MGPVANEATYKVMDLDLISHEAEGAAHGDFCMLNKLFAAGIASGG